MKTQKMLNGHQYLLLIACLAFAIPAFSDNINVAVAANFKTTLKTLKPLFEKQSNHQLTIISSGTGHLSNQILNGAPFDVFLSANEKHPKHIFSKLKNKRKLSENALRTYAHGRLVLLSGKPLPSKNLVDLLTANEFSRLALANAKLAPYGLAAQQSLQYLKLSKRWKGALIRGQNVAQVYQFVFTSNVDAGFVAYSMVKHLPKEQYILVPDTHHQPIKQVALQLNNKKISTEFMNFLISDATQYIIEQQGYHQPKAIKL